MSVPTTKKTMMPRTPLHRWLAVAFIILIIFYYRPNFTSSVSDSPPLPPYSQAFDDLTYVKEVLRNNSIGSGVSYASRTIRYLPDAPDRPSITEVDHELFPLSFAEIDIKTVSTLPAARPVEVHVRKPVRPDAIDASGLIFAASTTFERFTGENTSPVAEWSRWLTDGFGHSNGAGLILALFNTTEEEIDHTALKLSQAGINATVVPSDPTLDMAGRYVALVKMLYEHPTRDSRKYFALIDDDTFFPRMAELQRVLSRYDPSKPFYIGTFTERAEWLLREGEPFAYGGGGIFLTAPVARQITQLPCLEKNQDGQYILQADQGDRLLYKCLDKHTEITLTYLPELRQEDEFGDPSGLYESGQQSLSLHHYKSWHRLTVGKMHTVADACGEDCVLQRFQFKDNFIISNGYSVAEYPKGIDFDLLQMENTFDNTADGKTSMNYAFGGIRKSLSKTGRKRAWELLDARREGDGKVRQVYVKRRGDGRWQAEGEEHPKNDSVVVLLWIP